MTLLTLYQIDAFATRAFEGNPAAVIELADWLADDVLQAIAVENNLSETAYIVATDDPGRWRLRWFTPGAEVPLCGHATLASGALVLTRLRPDLDKVVFETLSGHLVVARDGDGFAMDLPASAPEPWTPSEDIEAALGANILASARGLYPYVEFENETAVRAFDPAKGVAAARLVEDEGELIITARGENGLDFVHRFFAPGVGIEEDPVTGSAMATLVPYWAQKLGKTELKLYQASPRGGHARAELRGDRVILTAHAVEVLKGKLSFD